MPVKQNPAIITGKLVLAKTGAKMEEWFRHLDSLGAQKMTSHEIYTLIAATEGLKPLGGWSQGSLTTSYQWDRGLRERGKKGEHFETGVSKIVNVPIQILFTSFVDEKHRKKWLDENIEITKQTQDKSARAVWSDGTTRLSVDFYAKGYSKSQIVVQHLKLPDSATATAIKELWGERLEALKSLLET